MQPISISKIAENLRKLPEEKLAVVYDFISYLAMRESKKKKSKSKMPSHVILSADEYAQLLRYKKLIELNEFAQSLGEDVEKLGLTEQELTQELEHSKREVFAEQYGRQ